MSAASASRIGVVAENTQGLKMRAQSRSLGAASRRSATSASRTGGVAGKGHRGDVAMRSTERPGEVSGATAEASSSMEAPAEYPSTARTRAIRNDEFAIPSMPPAQMEEKFLTGTGAERAHWFPVALANGLDEATMVPFDLFNVPWVMFRDGDGAAGCVKDECAHRACPLSLGKLVDGRAQCPYHGWEYTTGGECVKMPSIKKMLPGVYVDAAPVVERDGFLYLWAGKWEPGVEDEVLAKVPRRSLAPPKGFTPMAEVTVDIPMEAEEVLSRLMAPGGRTSRTATVSFDVVDAKRISDAVFPKIVANVLRGLRKPVPRSATFLPACVLDSTVGLEDGPGDWNVHQMHVVLPARPGRCRLLFRLSVDFVAVPEIARAIGGEVWANLAQMVLKEQLEGVRAGGVDDEKSYQEWKVSVSGDFD